MADESDGGDEPGEGSKSVETWEPSSILEKLVEEAMSREKTFQDVKSRIREIVDVDTHDAGHTYSFNNGVASVDVYVSEQLQNKGIRIAGELPSDMPLIDVLALLKGSCDIHFKDKIITDDSLSQYGLPVEEIQILRNREQQRQKRAEIAKQRSDRIYETIIGLEDPSYQSVKEALKSKHLWNSRFFGLKDDPIMKDLKTLIEKMGEIKTIAKEDEIQEKEYIEAGIERLKYQIRERVEKRVGYHPYHAGTPYINLPNLVMDYELIESGIKLKRAMLGKSVEEHSWMYHDMERIKNLTQEERKLLDLANSIEVEDDRSKYGKVEVELGKTRKFTFRTDPFTTYGYESRLVARELMDALFPKFTYESVKSNAARYSDGMGGNYEVC